MDWVKRSPELSEIVSEKCDMRRESRSGTVIIIPTYDNQKILEEHLERLKKQTFQDFDLLIVYGENDRFAKGHDDLSIMHVRERGRIGCAGAVYLGEKIALEEGYSKIIYADDDCYPVSPALIGELVEEIGRGISLVLPHIKHENQVEKQGLILHYACISSDVLRKTGLTFVPLYFGGEDVEKIERLRKSGFDFSHVPSAMEHKPMSSPMTDVELKKYNYIRGGFQALLLVGNYWRAFLCALFHLAGVVSFFAIGKKRRASIILDAIVDGSKMIFSRKSGLSNKSQEQVGDGDIIKNCVVFEKQETYDLDHLNYRKSLSDILYLLKWLARSMSFFFQFRKYFGKEIYFPSGNRPIHIPVMLMAKSAYIKENGRIYELFSKRKLSDIIFGIILVAVSPVFIITGSAYFLLAGMLNKRGIETIGYGITH